jgi:hypothetical protein
MSIHRSVVRSVSMRPFAAAALCLGALLFLLPAAAGAQVDRITFYTHMTADQAVPPSASGATAEAEFVLDLRSKRMTFRVVTQCVGPVPQLEVGLGVAGVNGPLIFTDFQAGYDMYEGTTPPMTDENIAALYAGNVYAQIATTFVLPGPEIRGQLQPVQHRNAHVTTLSGNQVKPPTGSAATGSAHLSINRPDNTITLDLACSGLPADAFMVELRFGTPTMNGPIIAAFGGGPERWGYTTSPLTPLSSFQLYLIEQGFTYLTVLSNAFPGGEIRGQIRPEATAEFVALMTGEGLLPATSSRATGLGRFVIDNATKVLSWTITVDGIEPTAVKLGLGTPGQATSFSVAVPGGPGTWSGALPINDVIIDLFYRMKVHVLVTSAEFPDGAIRGPIEPNPLRHGFGSDNGNGRIHVGHIGPHVLGNGNWTAIVTDTAPGSLAHLAIGFGNAEFNGVPLPLDLDTGAGIQRSFQWIDSTGGLDYFAVTDGLGYAAVNVPILSFPESIGVTAWYQWIVHDPVSGLVGVSDAMRVVVQ